MPEIPILPILTYTFAVWFGLYLLRQRFHKPGMRYTGLGLIAYAVGLAVQVLFSPPAAPRGAAFLLQERFFVAVLPFICWLAAIIHLFSSTADLRLRGQTQPPLQLRMSLRLVLVGSIFFGMSLSMLILPQSWFSSNLVVLAIGLDLALLSYGIAALDAYDEGEALSRDFFRSLGASFLAALLFGGQVALVMAVTGSGGAPMLLLLLALITSAVALQIFNDPLQTLLDRVLFSAWPGLRRERANLRSVASALPRVDETLDLSSLSGEEFGRLTRRALSHMGDLKRLAASPLARLPVITERLAARGLPDNTLDRAAELKALLAESVERLKPRDNARGVDNGGTAFGVSDEWRYYNVLYYPYVLGWKPNRQRLPAHASGDGQREVMEWFRAQVPERTLHNWQNAAAELVAKDLRERSGKL